MAVSSFRKALHRGYLKGFTIWLELEIGIMSEFWIYQGSEYARVTLWRYWCLRRFRNIPEYAWITPELCLSTPQYAKISLNDLILHFHILPLCLLERMATSFKVCTKLEDIVWMKMRVLFVETDFFIEDESICFFCFWLNSFISKISNFQLPFGCHESWCTLTGVWSVSNVHYILDYYFRKWCSVPFY